MTATLMHVVTQQMSRWASLSLSRGAAQHYGAMPTGRQRFLLHDRRPQARCPEKQSSLEVRQFQHPQMSIQLTRGLLCRRVITRRHQTPTQTLGHGLTS